MRLTYEDSCRELERLCFIERGQAPTTPLTRRPRFDDDVGVQFFRTLVEDAVLSNLTLPATFFGRSEIVRTSFANADFRQSTLCWNDFVDVDFSDACLTDCDLRASTFERVTFARADLRDTDLRQSSFVDCEFAGADMRGAMLTRPQVLELSVQQREDVVWQDEDGEEPSGG
jgi:uncharacterized protein YjbI with pentapeptide repeats